jgi:acyl dehydratase
VRTDVLEVLDVPRIVRGRAGFEKLIGREFVIASWYEITEAAVQAHVVSSGEPRHPGQTHVSGFMTASLAVRLFYSTFELRGFDAFLSYGTDRMRLPAQLFVGDRVRARIKIAEVRPFPGGADLVSELTFESQHADKPVCWLSWIARGYETRTRPGPGCRA